VASDVSGDELITQWELVLAATDATHRHVLDRIESAGVPPAWFTVLRLLLQAADRRLPMSTLAREVSMTSGGFTKLADRMAREGLIDRRGSSGDRRVVYATLTAAGTQLASHSVQQYQAALRENVLAVLSERRLRELTAAMQMLHEAHGRHEPAARSAVEPGTNPETNEERPRISPAPTDRGEKRGRS
jgi:DNA-binding MarR family transcriptional regulator